MSSSEGPANSFVFVCFSIEDWRYVLEQAVAQQGLVRNTRHALVGTLEEILGEVPSSTGGFIFINSTLAPVALAIFS